MRGAWLVGLTLAAGAAGADEVYLRSGGRLTGIVVRETATSVEIEVGAGLVTVPRSIIERIVQGPSALSQYQARLRAVSATDAAAWLELAEFARAAGLTGQARDAYKRVLALDPGNAVARGALGYRKVGEQWLTHEEAMQAQGYVFFEGEWVTPIQRDAVLGERESSRRERVEAERARAAVAEAEARAREAEARARTAEAEAKRAEERERERERATFVVGPPVWGWGFAPGPFVVAPSCDHRFHAPSHCPQSTFGSGLSVEWTSRPARRARRPPEEETRRHSPASAAVK